MSNEDEPPKIVRPLRWTALRADEAEKVIRERSEATRNVVFSLRAFDRIEERAITQSDVLAILREGHVEGEPELMKNGVDWKVVVTRRMPGGRVAGAVTVIYRPPADNLFVMTVEWMDWNR